MRVGDWRERQCWSHSRKTVQLDTPEKLLRISTYSYSYDNEIGHCENMTPHEATCARNLARSSANSFVLFNESLSDLFYALFMTRNIFQRRIILRPLGQTAAAGLIIFAYRSKVRIKMIHTILLLLLRERTGGSCARLARDERYIEN